MSSKHSRFFVLTLAGLIASAMLAGVLLARELESNCDLSGSLTYQGRPVVVGTTIQAYSGPVLLADTTVRIAGYYAISIVPDDTGTPAIDGWSDGAEITIYVDGHPAQPAVTPAGGPVYEDLSVHMISDVRKSTWGKIKALFR
jgi:hypothetical protein